MELVLPTIPKNPILYQINTRILLKELSTNDYKATLSDISDNYLDNIAELGFDFVWFLGVWKTGPLSREVSKSNKDWVNAMKNELPDLTDDDITGSPFAISSYTINTEFGTEHQLRKLKKKLHSRGVRLILDFVPNHVGLDHEWAETHPEYLIQGTEEDLNNHPENYTKIGDKVFAYGRDPNFSGWPDTLQLNYSHKGFRQAMIETIKRISTFCDGLRCDMAMLIIPSIFNTTWFPKNIPNDETQKTDISFWTELIPTLHAIDPTFTFMAEVYWDKEWELQQQGFRYTYDKRLYDRLVLREVSGVYLHLKADLDFMEKSVRFLENHDEKRATTVFGSVDQHMAAAVISFCVPGLKFIGDGQLEGFKSHISMHIGRRRSEKTDEFLLKFYSKILAILKLPPIRDGEFFLLRMEQAWDGNLTYQNFICFLLKFENNFLLVTVNYVDHHSQCFVKFDGFLDSANFSEVVVLRDYMGEAIYEREVNDIKSKGLFLDIPGWGFHVFQLENK